jgi:hypothetical protein
MRGMGRRQHGPLRRPRSSPTRRLVVKEDSHFATSRTRGAGYGNGHGRGSFTERDAATARTLKAAPLVVSSGHILRRTPAAHSSSPSLPQSGQSRSSSLSRKKLPYSSWPRTSHVAPQTSFEQRAVHSRIGPRSYSASQSLIAMRPPSGSFRSAQLRVPSHTQSGRSRRRRRRDLSGRRLSRWRRESLGRVLWLALWMRRCSAPSSS